MTLTVAEELELYCLRLGVSFPSRVWYKTSQSKWASRKATHEDRVNRLAQLKAYCLRAKLKKENQE